MIPIDKLRQQRLDKQMAHTFSHIALHIVFSTRKRTAILRGIDMSELARVTGGICAGKDAKLLAANGHENHVHLLASIRPKLAVADLVRSIKANTCNWIHNTYPTHGEFAWQKGYSAFSVSMSAMDEVAAYIARQHEHHRKMSFEEELMAFLQKHNIEYDERFVLDS